YRPVPEEPFRLGFQFSKLVYGTHKVLHPTSGVGSQLKLSDRLEHIVAKVAYDTCFGFNQDILRLIHNEPKLDSATIGKRIRISVSRTNRTLEDLRVVGLIQSATRINGRGRPTLLYSIAHDIQPV